MLVGKVDTYSKVNYKQNFGSIDHPLSGPFAKEIRAVIPKLKEEAKDLCLSIQYKDYPKPRIVATAITPNTLKSHLKKVKDVFEIAVSDDIELNMPKESKEQLVFDTAKKVIEQYHKDITTGTYIPYRGDDAISIIIGGIADFIKGRLNKGEH